AYDTVYYRLQGNPEKITRENYQKLIAGYGYAAADSLHTPQIIIAENPQHDSVKQAQQLFPATEVFSYASLQNKLHKKADGIIETCKTAVNICIGLIGIMALFMGFMSIAERAGGIRLLSKII